MGGPELVARGVVAAYGRTAVVHGVDVELRSGVVTALIGPNGSGKSTLLRALTRLHPPREGEVVLGPEAEPAGTLSPKELARRVSLLTQSHGTPGGVRVREVVEYGRHPHRGRFGAGDPDGPAVVERTMQLTGVTELAHRAVDTLSGGQLQRVWLASCLAQDTRVLLLDEPTTFLDLRYQAELLDLVRDLADEHGIAVGVVLHDLDQAATLADEVVLLVDGRVRAAGPVADVLTPAHLEAAYGIAITVHPDPDTGFLRTRAVARHHHRHLTATPPDPTERRTPSP